MFRPATRWTHWSQPGEESTIVHYTLSMQCKALHFIAWMSFNHAVFQTLSFTSAVAICVSSLVSSVQFLWKGYPCASCCSASHNSVLDMSTGDESLNSQSIPLTCELELRTAQRPFHTQEMHFALARHSFWMCQVAVQMWSILPLLTSFTIHWRVWCNAMSIVSWIQLTSQYLQKL